MNAELNRHIETTPGTRAGKPRLTGTRISVADVVVMHLRLGQSLAEIAGKYDLALAATHAAMVYFMTIATRSIGRSTKTGCLRKPFVMRISFFAALRPTGYDFTAR